MQDHSLAIVSRLSRSLRDLYDETEVGAREERAQFRLDVLKGLRSSPRRLSSVYFYDDRGSALFEQITRLPEYYLTRVEQQILAANADAIIDLLDGGPLCIVDLGAGSGAKTQTLLERLAARGIDTTYAPVDVSRAALLAAAAGIRQRMPQTRIQAVQGDYVPALAEVRATQRDRQLLILWLGSSIGNAADAEAAGLLQRLASTCESRDRMLIGFDLVKDPRALHAAYSDAQGLTAEFNYNLLRRINRELDANFDRRMFLHHAIFAPVPARMESYLVSRARQTVEVAGADFTLDAWEPILTEISCKYTMTRIGEILRVASVPSLAVFTDIDARFADVVCGCAPQTRS